MMVLQETRVRAEKMVAELKEKLTPKEIKAAKISAKDNLLEAIVKEILGRAKKETR